MAIMKAYNLEGATSPHDDGLVKSQANTTLPSNVVCATIATPLKKSGGRVASKTEASALESETKILLGRRKTAIRAAEYRPTLDQFSTLSFADYVRGVLMGVPLEGIPYEEPYDPAFDGIDASASVTATAGDDEISAGGPVVTPTPSPLLHPVVMTNKAKFLTPASSLGLHPIDSSIRCTYEISTALPSKFQPPGVLGEQQDASSKNSMTNKPEIAVSFTPTNVVANDKQEPERMKTRSQTRLQASPLIQKSSMSPLSLSTTASSSFLTGRKRRRNLHLPLLPCRWKLSNGISKITPPKGWWDHAGIACDLTARGPAWQSGTKLGDMLVSGPIRQYASGIGGVYDFTMLEMPPLCVAEFRNKADAYRKRQIGKEFDEDTSDEFIDNLARKFWRRLGPTMEASIYGADMEGSLFDGADACGWNIDRLESCLQLLRADAENGDEDKEIFKLPGVTSAYLYFGMWASVFAAHTEDMNLLSINYLHAGSPKYWYAISPEDSDRYESLMASHFSGAAASCQEFLRHKRYLLSPSILAKAGIRYKTQIQRVGDIVITFPGSYHFGFNTGFNIAESTNFAVPEWVPMGDAAQVCMCHPHSVRIDMKRFKHLLYQYESDVMEEGASQMTYTEWAKAEVKRRKAEALKYRSISCTEDDASLERKGSRTKGIVVEVMRSLPNRKQSDHVSSKKKKRTVALKKVDEKEDWRLALRVRRATFTAQTPVICFLTCVDEAKGKCFSGTISCVVEGHARIHFAGTHKKEDIWMPTDSTNLFLDGGPEQSPHKMNATGTKKKETLKKIKDVSSLPLKQKLSPMTTE